MALALARQWVLSMKPTRGVYMSYARTRFLSYEWFVWFGVCCCSCLFSLNLLAEQRPLTAEHVDGPVFGRSPPYRCRHFRESVSSPSLRPGALRGPVPAENSIRRHQHISIEVRNERRFSRTRGGVL